MSMQVCICGGGSQGHISAGVIGSNKNFIVNIFTRRPNEWSNNFITYDLDGKEYKADLNVISDNPADVVPQSDVILICLPGYAIEEELMKIKPFISERHIIGCVFGGSGFYLSLHHIFNNTVKSFALQRVPFTGRPIEYGHSARLKGYKPYLKVATENISDTSLIQKLLFDWYSTPVYLLSNYLEVTLSNSNPILHPCRLFVLFKDWTPNKVYETVPMLYDYQWDDESSQLWVDCDNELQLILFHLQVNRQEVPSILDYYECKSIPELTKKIRSIEPFKGVQPHMIRVDGGYVLDTKHRYFIEDIPFGLEMIKHFAVQVGVNTPHIDMVLNWAHKVMSDSKE